VFKFSSKTTPGGRRTQVHVSGSIFIVGGLVLLAIFQPQMLMLILPAIL